MKKTIDDNVAGHVTPVGGNLFADLGFSVREAKVLQQQSRQVILKKLAVKEQLMQTISTWIEAEHLTQARAAVVLGVTRPRVSDVMRRKNSNFTIDALIDMVVRCGQTAHIKV